LLQPATHTSRIAARGSSAPANLHVSETRAERNFVGNFDRNFRERGRKMKSSGGFLYFTGANACGAHPHVFRRRAHRRAYALQIRIPAAPPRIVRVANHVAVLRPFAAKFTLHRHKLFLLRKLNCSEAPNCTRRGDNGKARFLRLLCRQENQLRAASEIPASPSANFPNKAS